MKYTLLLCAAICFSAIAGAQSTGEITGKIFNKADNSAIAFAHVLVKNAVETVVVTESDLNGIYTAKPLPVGTYSMTIIALGYDTLEMTDISVSAGDFIYLDLPISGGIDLPEFVYQAPLVDKTEPQVETTITDKELKQQGSNDIADAVVKNVPAVQQNDKSGGLYVAGSREDATLYVIDGVRVIGSFYLPMNCIKEITVITGGIPANYGDFTGGVVEITTKGFQGAF